VSNSSKPRILIIGGTHGVEPQSAYYAKRLQEQLAKQAHIRVIPALNPDGLKVQTRTNARGVDLNRNMPSKNWQAVPPLLPNGKLNPYYGGSMPASEAETKTLLETIKQFMPELIISLHTNHYVQNPNPPQVNLDIRVNAAADIEERNAYGRKIAAEIAEIMQLLVTEDIGYATPGSLGSYAKDIGVPCITIEFDDELSGEQLWSEHGLSIVNLLAL